MTDDSDDVTFLRSKLRAISDFPVKGILFQGIDIFPLFQDPKATQLLVSLIVQHIKAAHPSGVDALVGLDARGFLLGPWIASLLQIPFAPVRKKGKLPGETLSVSYAKEYGVDHFEMQRDAVTQGQRVVVLDDLIATGGSAKAAEELVKHAGGSVVEFIFFIELKALEGRKVLKAPVHAILEFP